MSPVPTPNTLTVQVPHVKAVSNQGQSLPNLLSIAVPVPVTPASGTTSGMGKYIILFVFPFFYFRVCASLLSRARRYDSLLQSSILEVTLVILIFSRHDFLLIS